MHEYTVNLLLSRSKIYQLTDVLDYIHSFSVCCLKLLLNFIFIFLCTVSYLCSVHGCV